MGVVAWQLANVERSDFYTGNEWHSSFFGGAGGGLYWTAHLKTELDFGASTEARAYRSRRLFHDGQEAFQPSYLEFSRRTLGISQQYQFFENAWLHPHVAAGAHITWERRTEHFEQAYIYDRTTGRAILVGDRRTEGPNLETTVRPFVGAGFKAYMTPRSFFRVDTRLAFRNGIDESLVRVGFGVDF